jgi:hypothetical protein
LQEAAPELYDPNHVVSPEGVIEPVAAAMYTHIQQVMQ